MGPGGSPADDPDRLTSVPSSPGDGGAAVRSGVFLTGAQGLTRAVQVFFIIVATRSVSEGDFGRFSVSSGLLVLGGLVADLGTGPALTKLTSRRPERAGELLSGTIVSSAVLGALGWVGTTAAAFAIYGSTQATDVAIVCASLPFFAINTSLYAVLDGTGRMPSRATIAAFQPLIAAGVAGGVVAATNDIRAAMWLAPAGAATVTVIGLVVVARAGLLVGGFRPVRPVVREVLQVAAPFAVLSGLGSLSARFDVLLLGALDGPGPAASYDLALRSSEALWYLHTVVTAPTMVLLSRRLGEGDVEGARRAYDFAIRISYITGLGVSLVVVVLSGAIMEVLGGGGYLHSVTALTIGGSVLWLSYVSFVQGTLILAGDHLRAGLLTAGLLSLVTLVLDVGLIIPFGVRGAAVAAALAVAATVGGCALLHHRTLGWSTPLPPLSLGVVAALGLGVGLALRDVPVLAGPAALVTYGVGVAVTGAMTPAEVGRIVRKARDSVAG